MYFGFVVSYDTKYHDSNFILVLLLAMILSTKTMVSFSCYCHSCNYGSVISEILRVIDSLQLTATKKVATPVDWQAGKECMVLPTVSNEEAQTLFPNMKTVQLPSGKGYLRMTPQP